VHCTFRVRVQEDSKPGHELQRRVMHVCVCVCVCTCLVWVREAFKVWPQVKEVGHADAWLVCTWSSNLHRQLDYMYIQEVGCTALSE